MMLAVVCNISRFGGGMRIAPAARCDDGSLDLVVASELSKLAVLRVFPKIYSGRHVDHPAVAIERLRSASIVADSTLTIACDGEAIGRLDHRALAVTIVPGALWVVSQSTLNSTP
jgi:diacylglycerol kinase (ATP)